jgi:hypothetical protein
MMGENNERDDWWCCCECIWKRVRDAFHKAAYAVLGPPPPDVIEQIEEVMGLARYDFKQKKEIVKCRDVANGKQ